jgi:hypothetical protein
MNPFINEWMIEIRQYPREGEVFPIKDYFFYTSNTKEYGHRDTVIPVSSILNKEELPEEETIRTLINNRKPILRRMVDLNNQKESWIFDTNILEETKND